MTQYIITVIFILIGLIGAYVHYAKDRYFENKINCTLWFYITNDKKSTWNMMQGVIASAIPLAIAHGGDTYFLTLAEVYGMVGVGYGFDSLLNHAYKEK